MKAGNSIAKILSFILQPYLITFYCVVLLYAYTNFFEIYTKSGYIILISILLFSFIMPSIFSVLLKRLGYISEYAINKREERILPYMMTIFSNGMLIYYFYTLHLHFWFLGLIAAPTIALFIGFIVNFFWKISTHMLGIGSLIGSTFAVCCLVKGINPFIIFIILFILAGCLGVSRLYLKRNSPSQVYTGFIVGLIASFITVWVSLIFIK